MMTVADNFYRGYIETREKRPLQGFKSGVKLRAYEEVKEKPEFAGVLAENAVCVDIDDRLQAEKAMRIVESLQLDCRVYETTRGAHFLFLNSGRVTGCATGVRLACGLTADIKAGVKPSIQVLKFAGVERFIEWDIEPGGHYQDIPEFFLPIKGALTDFHTMTSGRRNQALFNHILTLENAGLTKEEIRKTIQIINVHVLDEPLPESEIETITRDEAFGKQSFFKGGTFLHAKFAAWIMAQNSILRIDNQLHIYHGGVYGSDIREIGAAARRALPTIKRSQKSEVLDYIGDMAPLAMPAPPSLIAFSNGILDISTGFLEPHTPAHVLTNGIPWSFNSEAYHALADRTLSKIACRDADTRALLEEVIGYCMYRSNRLQKAFILIGDKANGKSTFLSILYCLLGEPNVSALDLANLGDRFAKAELYGKLANIGDDISDEWIPDPSLFKKIVTGDRISAEKKGQDMFSFNPYATLLFSANSMPRIKDRTGAVIRRLMIVPFDAKFSPEDADYDPGILSKLTTPEALEYFVLLGVEGLARIIKNKRFTEPERVRCEIEEYEAFNQPVLGFVKEHGEDYLYRVSAKEIYLSYASYCIDNGLKPEGKIHFGRTLKTLYGVEGKAKRIDGSVVWVYAKEE